MSKPTKPKKLGAIKEKESEFDASNSSHLGFIQKDVDDDVEKELWC